MAVEVKKLFGTDSIRGEEIPKVQAQVAKAWVALGEANRIVLRYSATQDPARVMIKGDDQEVIERETQAIADVIQQVTG